MASVLFIGLVAVAGLGLRKKKMIKKKKKGNLNLIQMQRLLHIGSLVARAVGKAVTHLLHHCMYYVHALYCYGVSGIVSALSLPRGQ